MNVDLMKKEIKFDFKVLAVHANYLLGARGYKIFKYSLNGKCLELVGVIDDKKYGKWADYKLSRRLMRAEITALYEFENECMLAIAKKGFFLKEKGDTVFRKVFNIPRGSKPLNICITKDNRAYFGEYFQNMDKTEVHVYGSEDSGRTWKIVYTFSAGNINHIHGLYLDPYTERIWIVTGDRENECIIGWTDDGFRSFHEEFRGGQKYRSCQLFFYKNFIIYATDSQYIENEIRAIIKVTGILWHNSPNNPLSPKNQSINRGILSQWSELIDKWIKDPSIPLIVRKDAQEGQVITHPSGREIIVTDNTFAVWVFEQVLKGYIPSLKDMSNKLGNKKAPRGNMTGWKLRHIKPVGLNTKENISNLEISVIEDHFRKYADPNNMFVLPKEIGGLGEIDEFINEQ